MQINRPPGTAAVNGKLWGARARDWAELQEGQLRPVYEEVLSRTGVGDGTAYLDVGCGAGMAVAMASARGATSAGLDASAALLEIARARTPGADLREGELEALPFADAGFNVVTAFNSIQFAQRPLRALEQARRVLRRSGSLAVVTWAPPDGMEASRIVTALGPLLPAPLQGAPGPFALSQEHSLRFIVSEAGFKPREVADVECFFTWPDLTAALRGLASSGVAVRAAEHSGQAAVDAAYEKVLAPFRQSNGQYRLRAVFRYLLATAWR